MKLSVNDITFMDEGQQAKLAIEAKYGSLKHFFESEDTKGLSLKAIRNYCSYSSVNSRAFKLLLVEKLDMGLDSIILTKSEQIMKYVKNIYSNILLYNQEEDLQLFEKVLGFCKEYNLIEEKAILYRCIAKNYFYRDLPYKTAEFYHHAIGMLTEDRHYNTLIILHSELAYHLSAEMNMAEAEEHFNIAERLCNNEKIDSHSKYSYNYRRGVVLNSQSQYEKAREHFTLALNNAHEDNGLYSETGDALLAIGSTYKRQGNFEQAKDFYFKSLLYVKENDINGRGMILNNISDIYYTLGNYEKASAYMEDAISIIQKSGKTHLLLICIETYAAIKYKTGEKEALNRYFDYLKDTVNTSINKRKIRDSISRMLELLREQDLLNEFEKIINYLIQNTTNENYVDELYACIGRLHMKAKYKEVQHEKSN